MKEDNNNNLKSEDKEKVAINPITNSGVTSENKPVRNSVVIEDDIIEKLRKHDIPEYLLDVYDWAYVNPKNIDRLDNAFVYHLILFGQGWRLMNQYLNEIKEGDRVLQVAHVYGNLLKKIATKVGEKGALDVIDVVPYQIEKADKKLAGFKNVETWIQDAIVPFHRDYNVIGVYFLLHEVPDNVKKQIIENVLAKIDDCNAKIVFIDYHNPNYYHPVRPILSLVNTFLEPFAGAMWEREIHNFTNKAHKYNWEKQTFFGGVYQKVTVTKKQ